MCNTHKQATIAAYEVTEGTVTYCTFPGWSKAAKEIVSRRTKNFVNSCWCCGRGINETKGGVAYVHLRIDGGLFRVDSEMTDAYEQANSQGWFPIGSVCKRKYFGYFKVLDVPLNP
jgi:hypothetical protein